MIIHRLFKNYELLLVIKQKDFKWLWIVIRIQKIESSRYGNSLKKRSKRTTHEIII